MSEIIRKIPLAGSTEHPGKYDVLRTMVIEHTYMGDDVLKSQVTLNDLAEISGNNGRDPRTVEATIFGDERTNGMECVIVTPVVEDEYNEQITASTPLVINFDPELCSDRCEFWGQCPLQEAIVPAIREKMNVSIEARSIGIDVLGATSEIPETTHAEFYDLIMRGNLGRFEISSSQYVDKFAPYSRNLVLTHPDFPEQEFVVTMGLVTFNNGRLDVQLPDTSRNVQDVYKGMGTTFIKNKRRVDILNRSALGSYPLDRLQTKVDGMDRVNKVLGNAYHIAKTISYGQYNGNNDLNNLGWLVYSRPKDVKLMSRLTGDIYRNIPNVLSRFAAFEGRDIQSLLGYVEIEFGKLLVDNVFALEAFHRNNIVHNQWHTSNIRRKGDKVYIADLETVEFTTDPYAKANEIGYMLTRFTNEIFPTVFSGSHFVLDSLSQMDSASQINNLEKLKRGDRLKNLQLFVQYVTDTMLKTFSNVYWMNDEMKKFAAENYMSNLFDEQYGLMCGDLTRKLQNTSNPYEIVNIYKGVLNSMEDIASRLAGRVAAGMFLLTEGLDPDSLDESFQKKQKVKMGNNKGKVEANKTKKQQRKASRKKR